VEIGAADRARGNADDRVGFVLNARLFDVVEANVADAVKHDSLHVMLLNAG
jgi:hypothetical protein